MRHILVIIGLSAFVSLAGCAAETSAANPDDDATSGDEELKKDPAIQAFLADPAVKREIGGRKASTPQSVLLESGSFGHPVKRILVSTFVDVTRPGIMDARITKPVLAEVFIGTTGGKPTVRLADVKDTAQARDATDFEIPSMSGAIGLYKADPSVKAELAGKRASEPVALQLTAGSSFGRPTPSYLVLSMFDATPPGALDARITRAVFAHVIFRPNGDASVALADVVTR